MLDRENSFPASAYVRRMHSEITEQQFNDEEEEIKANIRSVLIQIGPFTLMENQWENISSGFQTRVATVFNLVRRDSVHVLTAEPDQTSE